MKFWRAAAFSALALSAVITVDSLRRIWKLRRQIENLQEDKDEATIRHFEEMTSARCDAYEEGIKYAMQNIEVKRG